MSGIKAAASKEERKESRIPIPPTVPVGGDPLELALGIVGASRGPARTITGPDGYEILSPGAFDASTVASMRSFLGPREYSFRLSRISTITSGTGVLAVNIATDLTVYAEGSALAALFDECKLVRTRLRLAYNSFVSYQSFPFMIGYERTVLTTTPTSTAVARLPDSKLCYYGPSPTLPNGDTWDLSVSGHGRPYGMTVDEGISSPRLVSGLNGTFKVVNVTGTATPVSSSVHFAYTLTTIAKFRSRG